MGKTNILVSILLAAIAILVIYLLVHWGYITVYGVGSLISALVFVGSILKWGFKEHIYGSNVPKRYRILQNFTGEGREYKKDDLVDTKVAMKWRNFKCLKDVGYIEEYWLDD